MNGSSATKASLIAVLLISIVVPLSNAADVKRAIIRVKGSNIMAGAVDALGKSFMAGHPGYVVVVSGGGTPVGIKALLDQTVEVAAASRKMNDKEREIAEQRKMDVVERRVGWEALALIAHPENPINELSLEQVRKLFIGEYALWSQLGGPESLIIVYTSHPGRAGTAAAFQEIGLKGAAISAGANTKEYFRHISREVAMLEEAIAYFPLSKAVKDEAAQKVKILPIKADKESPAVVPSGKTISDKSYPLIMPLYLCYVRKSGATPSEEFVDYCAAKSLPMY